MSQSPGEPPHGDPRYQPPADPYRGYDPYQAPGARPDPTREFGEEPTHQYGGGSPQYGGGSPPPPPHPPPSPYASPTGGYDVPPGPPGPPGFPPGPPGPPPSPPPGAPGFPPPEPGYVGYHAHLPLPPRRRRRGPLIGLVIGLAVLVTGLASVGGWLLMRDPDRGGAPDPIAASEDFLKAVYRDFDPAAAAALVCSQARDEAAISAKINELRVAEQTYVEPRYTWGMPEVVHESQELATVAVTITMTTGDERLSHLEMELVVLDKDPEGWWVCDIRSQGGPGAPEGGPVLEEEASPPPEEEGEE